MLNEKQFNSTLAAIKKTADNLAQDIHAAAIFSIAQANEHGNIGFATRLVDAMGKKHDAQRVVNWLVHFGKIGVKKGLIVFRKRKDINAENLEAILTQANDCPYWLLTPQKKLVENVDYLAMLASMVKKHQRIESGETEGKEYTEKNTGILPEIQAIIAKYTKPKEAPATPASIVVM